MARPRKDEKTKTKGRKGTGTINKCVQKNDRKERRLSKMCKTCSECKDRSVCENRKGRKACDICKKCTNKNCDRFYISIKYKAFSPQINNSPREYLGSFDTQEEAQKSIDKYKNGGFVEKSNVTLYDILEMKNTKNINANAITIATDDRNLFIRKKMKKKGIGNKPIQKINENDIQEYLNSLQDTNSQSEINKHRDEIKYAINYAILNNMITDNPMKNVVNVTSSLKTKKARPFEIDEQQQLLDYINTTDNLTDIRSRMDTITFRNIINLSFASGQRIGEILALQQTGKKHSNDVDFEKKKFTISKTITHERGKLVLVNRTKNDKKRLRQGLPRERDISFNIAPPNVIENIFNSQLEHLKEMPCNPQHFLFCNIDGTFVNQHQVTETLKRICRELHIQDDEPKGCYIHQARHSFVTRCLEAGLKVETIADLIGDTVEQVQKTYAHILPRFKDDETSKLHNYYEKNNIKY